MDHASQFFKNFFGSLILISQPPHSPSSPTLLAPALASPVEFPTTDSPTLPPRNDGPIAEVRKGTWRDHAAVLIPDPGYFVAGGLAGVASRKSTHFISSPLTSIQATRSVLLNKHIWAIVGVGRGLGLATLSCYPMPRSRRLLILNRHIDCSSRSPQGVSHRADEYGPRNRCCGQVGQPIPGCGQCLAAAVYSHERAMAGWRYAQSICWCVSSISYKNC